MIQSGPCSDCGAQVERSLDGLPPKLREMLARTPFCCADCVAAEEQQEREQEAERQRQRDEEAHHRRIRASGLPDTLHDITALDRDALRADAIDAARAWATGEPHGLLLHGPVGTGKTRLAAAAAWALLARRSLRWYSVPVLLARLGAGFETPQRDQALDALTGTHALVLDDLDKARPTEYGGEQIFLAIDSRLAAGVPLLATSNRTVDELAKRWPEPYGEAIASRLTGYCQVCEVGGDDRRRPPVYPDPKETQ